MSSRQVVYLKIPVERNGFVDPPSIKWSEAKEQRLWNIVSKSKRTEVDWIALSEQLGVPVTFLQQQAFWLYEQELEQLKNRIRKGTLSSDTIIEERSTASPSQTNFDVDLIKPPKLNIFDKKDTTIVKKGAPFKQLKFQIHDDQIQQNDNESDEDQDHGLGSDTTSNSSSEGSPDKGSMLLHRSRILSKAPPTFNNLDEDEEYEIGKEHSKPAESRGSSLSNFSSVSITKSALEEALLDESNF